MKAILLVVLLLFLPALWKGENLNKVTLGNSYWTRESKYDIGVGSINETQQFLIGLSHSFLIGLSHSEPSPY